MTLGGDEDLRPRAAGGDRGCNIAALPLDRLEELEGAGIFYSATEMEARFCAQYRRPWCSAAAIRPDRQRCSCHAPAAHVHLVVRGASLAASMSSYLSQRLEADPRVTIHYHSEVTALHGDNWLKAITLRTGDSEQRIATPRAVHHDRRGAQHRLAVGPRRDR